MLPIFLELLLLLAPGTYLYLHLIGPDVPVQQHGQQHTWRASLPAGAEESVLTVALWHGRYDQVLDAWRCMEEDHHHHHQQQQQQQQQPHLVFAPNAGLPAFPSWGPSLRRLLGDGSSGSVGGGSSERIPFLATDYCEEAVWQSMQLLRSLVGPSSSRDCCFDLGGGDLSGGHLNPFRRPYPTIGHGTALPACANALVFGWV